MSKIQTGYQIINDPRADYLVPLPTVAWFENLAEAKRAARLALSSFADHAPSVWNRPCSTDKPNGPWEGEVPSTWDKQRPGEWVSAAYHVHDCWEGVGCLLVEPSDRWIEWMDEYPA